MSAQSIATGTRRLLDVGRLPRIQNVRHVVQAAFVLFILYATVLHIVVGENGPVVTASPEAYCPFGGFETLYKYITSGGKFVSHAHLSNLMLFLGVLLVTVVARGAFCGWICPFGTLQEWLYGFSAWLQKRVPVLGKAVRALKARVNPKPTLVVGQPARRTVAQRLDHWLRYFKYVFLGWIIWGTVAYGVMVFREVDPWAALLTITELEAYGGLLVLIIVAVAALFVERPWCRYACPLGAIIGVVGKISPLRIQREGAACSGCALCDRKCPVGIAVASATDITDANCNMCLRCVDSCPKPGALELKLVVPGMKAQ